MEHYYYGYDEFKKDCRQLTNKLKIYEPDTLVAISRGGLTLGHFLAEALGIRRLFTINSIHYDDTTKLDTFEIFNIPDLKDAKKVVILDDIIDSGETMHEILRILGPKYPDIEFKLGSIFYKKDALIKADFTLKEAKDWIDFFWVVDLD